MNVKTTISFGALPGVVYQSRLPDARGRGIDYTVMRLGSDEPLYIAAPSKVEVEVTHPEDMPHYRVVARAYRKLLNAIDEETWAEFQEAYQRKIDEQQVQPQL